MRGANFAIDIEPGPILGDEQDRTQDRSFCACAAIELVFRDLDSRRASPVKPSRMLVKVLASAEISELELETKYADGPKSGDDLCRRAEIDRAVGPIDFRTLASVVFKTSDRPRATPRWRRGHSCACTADIFRAALAMINLIKQFMASAYFPAPVR